MKVRRVMPEEGWTPIANAAHRDYRLSWRARGLLGELLSYPDGWDITVDKLVAQAREVSDATEGRAAMRKAVGELAELGYVRYIRDVDEHGHWTTAMSVSDVPQPEPDARRTRNRTVGEPDRRSSGTSVDRTVGEPDCRETETSGDWSITRKKDTKTVTKNDQKTTSPLPATAADAPPGADTQGEGEGVSEHENQINDLVDTIHQIRPRWSKRKIAEAITDSLDDGRPWDAIVERFPVLAADPETRHPGRLTQDGPWWDDINQQPRTSERTAGADVAALILKAQRDGPHCDHETAGGSFLHPIYGTPLCALCRRGLPSRKPQEERASL